MYVDGFYIGTEHQICQNCSHAEPLQGLFNKTIDASMSASKGNGAIFVQAPLSCMCEENEPDIRNALIIVDAESTCGNFWPKAVWLKFMQEEAINIKAYYADLQQQQIKDAV